MKRVLLFAVVALAVRAQDERRVVSPNGQVEFRLFIATQTDSQLSRLAYEVYYRGQPLLKTSFMGLDIEVQEPLLGENVGLTSVSFAKGEKYNSLVAKYMQNGSLGRLIDVEARAYNDGVAFRYVIPVSTPLLEMRILEEATEFRFAGKAEAEFHAGAGASVVISEVNQGTYPKMRLVRSRPDTEMVRLERPFQTGAPLICPWRIVSIGASGEEALRSSVLADLGR